MKLWIDDLRPAPAGYYRCFSVNETIQRIEALELMFQKSGGKKYYAIEVIDLDHDAGAFAKEGGDYIEILNWMERTGRNYITSSISISLAVSIKTGTSDKPLSHSK